MMRAGIIKIAFILATSSSLPCASSFAPPSPSRAASLAFLEPKPPTGILRRATSSASDGGEVSQRGQTNNNVGWAWMVSYWSAGMLAGSLLGYLPRWTATARSFTLAHAAAAAVTAGITPRFLTLYTDCGRSKSFVASSLMAVANGISETMLMLAAYDLGAVRLGGTPVLGYLLFTVYSFLTRRLYWCRLAFPRHIKLSGTPFYAKGLPEMQAMSLSWMAVYATTGDVAFVCVLHAIFNFCCAMTMGLQPPSLFSQKQGNGN